MDRKVTYDIVRILHEINMKGVELPKKRLVDESSALAKRAIRHLKWNTGPLAFRRL